ncbi:MAG: SpoIIE family protein phosphatase [Actinomycetota bacterium]|nr:SpoIIE family protein phosphatase [Actinomycetota bacterium]
MTERLAAPVPASEPSAGFPSSAEAAAARRLLPRHGTSSALDRLADLAARLVRADAAQVSLLSDVQTVAGGAGLPDGAHGSQGALEDSLCTVTAASRAPLVVPDAPSDARVRDLAPVTAGVVGSYLGVPLVADDGNIVGVLCVFDRAARTWSDADLEVLEQLAPSIVAELELSALSGEYDVSRTRWDLARQAAGIGTFDWDLRSGALSWDDRLLEIFGYADGGFDGSIRAFDERVHPDDLPRVTQALEQAIQSCGTYDAEYRVVLPDGTRWVHARGRALGENGAAVRLLGAASDTTAVREGEARISRVLETMPSAFYFLDRDWRLTYVNAEAERLLGRSREELLGGVIWELFPDSVGSEFERHYRGAMESGKPTSFEAYYPAPLDGWYELRAWPAPDGLSVYFADVTARRSELERSTLIAGAAAELTETLDLQTAVARLARMVVPALADWCIVSLVDDDLAARHDPRRGLRDVGSWHADPAMRPVLERYTRNRIRTLDDLAPIVRALRSRDAVVVTALPSPPVATHTGEDTDQLVGHLSPRAHVIQPIRARGRTLGLLTLCWRDRGEPRPEDVDTVAEIANRAGLALDNARLYEQQRNLAEQLQRSLLTRPPQPDHLQIAVRYVPAASVAQVGGDWYDSFLQRDGHTVLVIGDVVGHDTQAAAAMGQIRGLLRGIAASSGGGPATVLAGLDETIEVLQLETTATAVIARFEQTEDERASGVTRMRWSNAGHPAPVVLAPDGTVSLLSPSPEEAADLLLGIDAGTTRTESVVTLPYETTVLLYTDGLVERRGQSLDEGQAALCATLREMAHLGLEELCDAVLTRFAPEGAEDDVALAALRLLPQGRPRPPQAGPTDVPASLDDRSGD